MKKIRYGLLGLLVITVMVIIMIPTVAFADTTVTELNITYDADACKIDTSLTEGKVDSKIAKNSSLAEEGTITKPDIFDAGLAYWNQGTWYGVGDGTKQVSSDKQYALSFALRLKDGYLWPDGVSSKDMSNVKIIINGKEYKPSSDMIFVNPFGWVYIYYIPDDQRSKISILEASTTTPTLYKSPSYEVTTAGEGYEVSVENWYINPKIPELEGGTVMTPTDKFREGNKYMVELKFTAAEGYSFVDKLSVRVKGSSGWRIESNDSKTVVVFSYMAYAQHEHNYQTVTTKATTSQNGSIVTKCSLCGDVKSTTTIYYPKTIKLSSTSYTYNGYVISPTVSVIDASGKSLVNGTDYTVTVPSGRKDAGTYTYTVNFIGNYSGNKSLSMTINKASYTLTAKSYVGTYNGKKHYITLGGVKSGSVIMYRTSPTKPWTTTIPSRTSVGKTIVYYQITNKNFNTITGYKTIVNNPVKTSITKLSRGKKSFAVKWAKKTTQTTGYQIQYSTSSSFKSGNKAVTVTSNKATGKTIKGLKAKKKYYVRVRTYKTVSGVKYYSGWSTKKYIVTR